MRIGDRSDAELVELARTGWVAAFAVLFHRYAPVVHGVYRGHPEPRESITAVFLQAMSELGDRDPDAPVAPWLLEIAGASAPPEPEQLSDEDLDAIWVELSERWPDGRRAPREVPWRRLGTLAALVALAALVPAVVLGVGEGDDPDDLEELRAVPLPDEDQEAPEVEEADEEPELEFSSPASAEEGAEQEPTSEPEPLSEPAPEPEPEPEPEPQEPDGEAVEDDEVEPLEDEGEDQAPDDDEEDENGGLLPFGPDGDPEDEEMDREGGA